MSWSLAPFLASVALYWAALIPDTQPSLLALGTTTYVQNICSGAIG